MTDTVAAHPNNPFTGPADFASVVDQVRRHYDDGCFACGRANPLGLKFDDFKLNGDRVSALFRPRPEHRGTFGVLHGGLAATALDEIMAWSGIVVRGVLCVTATLAVRYRQPIAIEEELVATGWVVERSGRRLKMAGEVASAGQVAVEGNGLYVVAHQVAELLSK